MYNIYYRLLFVCYRFDKVARLLDSIEAAAGKEATEGTDTGDENNGDDGDQDIKPPNID